ncbi:13269_t:CDS:10, partial [Gigaspora margarita]
LCEDTICYILDIIHNKAKISGNFNISNDEQQLLLFGASKFWVFLLNANGKVNKLNSHPNIKYVRSQISQLVYSIRDRSIQFGLLKTLFESENYELINYFNAGYIDDENFITEDILKFLRDKLNEHYDIIEQLFSFYNRYCDNTDDVQIYLEDLYKKVNALNVIPFSEILSQDYWSPHKMMIIEVSKNLFHYAESQTFANIVNNYVEDNEIQLSVSNVAENFTNKIIKQYQNTCLSYKNWKNIKCSEAQELWKGIDKEQVKPELEIMANETSWKVQNNLIESIEFLTLIPTKISQLYKLSKVLNDQFRVKNAERSWVVEMMNNLENDMKLSELSGFFQELNNHLNELNESSWSVINELSLANEFIVFLLRNLIGMNLTNLTNAVDDQSDTKPLKEAVTALIEVNKVLEPLNEDAAKLSIIEFLNRLCEISKKNPSLAGKIRLCGSNNLALQNMYRNMSNKGEVTKERIKNAATIGIYKFKHNEDLNTCELTMKYDMTQSQKSQNENSSRIFETFYNMADLHDLYSRALLIGKSRTSTDQLFDDSTNNIRLHVNQFVTQMDLAQQIVTIASKLIQSGHFLYQKICIEKHGSELQQTLNKLSHDLEIWNDVVDRAQNENYYLTFFSARHILAFYNYFKGISNVQNHENNENYEFQASNQKTCQNLVRFINDAAHLPEQTDVWSTVQNENDLLPVLRKIGITLYMIFNGIKRQVKLIPNDLELVVADTVYNGKLFVADCHSYSLVPNVILSLFVNHESIFPETWQILICQSTTTEEEISLFIKRSFTAAKNGYKNFLFCIANVELLDFGLQYHLVQSIRNFQDKEKDYFLALICTREKCINHHILEQFAENVYSTNGLDERSMKLLYSEICNNSVCVTSNLSGQGKTEWIKESSSKKGKALRTLLISDKVNFETLVQKLVNCKLDTFESLHIDINLITYPHDVNFFLFQLLTFGKVCYEMNIVNLQDTLFFIEITSTVCQYLLESLSITKYIRRQHVEWDLKNLVVPHQINSPIHIVSYYMDAYSRDVLDDINIQLTGTEAIRDPLPIERCQELLRKYFFSGQSDNVFSYRFLDIFVNVLADQLIQLSSSSFFQVEQLRLKTNETKIRSSLFEILISCTKEFATRAINVKDMQKAHQDVDRARLGNLVQWNDSNHLVFVFSSQMPNSIFALYRDKTKVPKNIENLLKSQKMELQDYHKMESTMLLEILERLAIRKVNKLEDLPEYALSIENLLKMAIILSRTRANIPVVCCGEACCGKVKFITLNFHAGIQECDISNFIKYAEELANEDETWLFLDEINTCDHIGILGSLISRRIFNDKLIHPNIRILAACNPYRLRTKTQSDVGLSAKLYEEKSKLVYQVHPLPDQILDYVWDYSYLKADDEKNYIDIMVKTKLGHSLFAELLYTSQAFIRNVEEPFSVSLRDVKRAIKLFKFFKKFNPSTEHITDPLEIRPMILALSLCYLFRFHNQSQRKLYREEIIAIIEKDPKYNNEPSKRQKQKRIKDLFEKIISKEQEIYTKKMQLPEGTALNEALLENILVMIVCVLTRIPVFIIGATGSSKSLAVRIISMNLRGADSRDPYFKTLPQIYMIPYHFSASSTSEGIIKVFETAEKYQYASSIECPMMTVVILDGVELAETSPHNPLKVLHSLLEPPLGCQPVVSVIGMSSRRLDISKSSRALLIQHPLFTENDLVDTAKCLLGDKKPFSKVLSNLNDFLSKLAKAYLHYVENQKYPNFHGLRDYYSLVKNIRSISNKILKENFHRNIQIALARNFGGADNMQELCTIYFKHLLKPQNNLAYKYVPIPVQELIDMNFEEKDARNLMLIGNSNSIVSLQIYRLRRRDIEPVVIIGSQFPDDKDGDDYSHAILNRIMICVETGTPLILTDLEILYGSFYDLFNQNFLSEGNSSEDKKNFARVSLGAYSSPMLYVHPNFRCILVLDESKLPYTDPPLLNRFEKQKLTLEETLSEREEKLFMSLKSWANQISTIFKTSDNDTKFHFSEKDMFIGFSSEETLQSLVVDQCERNEDYNDDSIIDSCKKALISIATLDGIIRADKSFLKSSDAQEVKKWQSFYLQNRQHDSIQDFYKSINDCLENDLVIINTFSNINTDIKLCLKEMNCQIDKLSAFKSEAELQNQVKRFYESNQNLYILQCDSLIVNAGCIRLAKFIIEQYRNKFLEKTCQQNINKSVKRSCIILHFNRQSNEEYTNIFNFMGGWAQITIESLIAPEKSPSLLLNSKISEILYGKFSFEQILNQELLWSLLCMRHPSSKKSVEHIRQLVHKIPRCMKLVNCLKARTEEWLQVKANLSDNWQLNIALDQKFLSLYPSFYSALEMYIRLLIRKPIAKLLYILEKYNAITPLFSWDDENDLFKFWKQIFMNKKIINIDEIFMDPQPNLYRIPGNHLNLRFPFSHYFMKQIDQYKSLYQKELENWYEQPENWDVDDNLHPEVIDEFSAKILAMITTLTPEILQLAKSLYFEDFVTIQSANAGYLNESDVKLLQFIFRRLRDNETLNCPVKLHIFWWDNSDTIIAELKLARMCPSISEFKSNLPKDVHFRNYVINEIVIVMLGKIISLKDETIDELIVANYLDKWQQQVIDILSLCSNFENYLESKSLQFLRICNDLVSNDSINILNIIDTISIQLEHDPEYNLSQEFVDSALKLFGMPATEQSNTSQCSFFRRCLDIIPIDSPVRIHLYEILFGQEPRTFIGSVLSRVLLLEENLLEGIFINLIKNAKAVLGRSPHLKAINTALQNSGIDSRIMALCCDVIQNDFFAEWTFKDLTYNFNEAIEVLCSNNFEPLQLVLAVALLKKFVNGFWISLETIQTIETEPITYDDADIEEVIDKINHAMRRQSSLIHSFKLYFLRSLYDNGISLHGIKCFCKIQSRIFQWLADFNWDESNNKIGFIAYRCYDKYIEAVEAFTALYSRGQQEQFENFLNQVSINLSTSVKMSIMGTLITHLYDIRAIRGLRINEEIAIQCLQDKLPNMHFDKFYRDKLLSFLENNNPLSPETNALGHFMSYECQCGYKYISGMVQKSNCPQCGSIAEGVQCIVNLGKRCKAAQGLNNSNEKKTQLGYVYESIESRKNYNFCLRNLTPVSYRILHLFVHVLIAAAASSIDQRDFFTNSEQNNENQNHAMIEDLLDYCQQHIENDWQILTLLFDCDDETLAFIFHSILHSMSEINLSQQMKDEINEFVDFDKSHDVDRSGIKMSKIPYRIFEIVLKRFMFRYLSSELYDTDEKLAKYLSDNCDEKHSDCWPFWVSNDVILDKFPKSLLVENIYSVYQYTIQNATKSNSHKTNNSFQNNNRQNKNQRSKTSNTANTGASSRTNRNHKRNE